MCIRDRARATSYFSPVSYFNDLTGGIGFYHFLEKVVKEYEAGGRARNVLIAKLREIAGKLFRKENLLVSYTADDKGYELFAKELESFVKALETSSFKETEGARCV